MFENSILSGIHAADQFNEMRLMGVDYRSAVQSVTAKMLVLLHGSFSVH